MAMRHLGGRRRSNLPSGLRALLFGAGLTFVLFNFDFSVLESFFYDFRMRYQHPTSLFSKTAVKNSQIAIVSVSDESLESLADQPPLSFQSHTAILEQLSKAGPKAIGYLSFPNITTNDEQSKPELAKFVQTAQFLWKTGIPVWIGTKMNAIGEATPLAPLNQIPHRIATLYKDGVVFAEDKVTRRALFSFHGTLSFHSEIASAFNQKRSAKDYYGIYFEPNGEAEYFLINYSGPTQNENHPFIEFEAYDVISGNVDLSLLKDRIVLIGSKLKNNLSDFAATPYSVAPLENSNLVVHAYIIDSLVKNIALSQLPKGINLLVTWLLTSMVIFIVFRTKPAKGVMMMILLGLGACTVSLFIFRYFHTWVPLAHPLLGIFIAYYFFVPYRLIKEYEKRSKVQKKHEVLRQVEELKSNFMSLITHDLKTPVAKIQGIAEMLRRQGADEKMTSELMNSSDELNHFISTIIELAKLQQNQITLKKESRDINKVIEDCVLKFSFQAKKKNILIQTDLEPLFPIRMDVGLISKVVSNLLDNAVKYSPEGSVVTIETHESEEHPSFVEISVTDTGMGISKEEQSRIFEKFYRSKNEVTQKTKGTGVGLYLSRYFVELHKGLLVIDSVEGKGSMFTILLPMSHTEPSFEIEVKETLQYV